MIKKTMTYTDYDGNQRTEDFYFNLTKAELAEMELSHDGGFVKLIERVIQTRDISQLTEIFKNIILQSYGVKSPDGKRFIKNDEVREEFAQTEAYSDLFIEFITDAEAAAAFVNGIIPKIPPSMNKGLVGTADSTGPN